MWVCVVTKTMDEEGASTEFRSKQRETFLSRCDSFYISKSLVV